MYKKADYHNLNGKPGHQKHCEWIIWKFYDLETEVKYLIGKAGSEMRRSIANFDIYDIPLSKIKRR